MTKTILGNQCYEFYEAIKERPDHYYCLMRDNNEENYEECIGNEIQFLEDAMNTSGIKYDKIDMSNFGI